MRPSPDARPRPPALRGPTAGMVAATLLWGATFVVLRDSLRGLDPVVVVCVRFAAAALILFAAVALRRRALDRTAIVGGMVSGLACAFGYLFQAIGLTRASAGTSAFLTCTGTLLAGFFAWPLLGQRPSLVLVAGIGLAMVGSLLLPARGGFHLGAGEAWTLAGAVSFALQIVAVARFAPRVDPFTLAAFQALLTSLMLWPFAGATAVQLPALDAAGWWRLGYLVLAGSVVAPLLQIAAQRSLPAGRVGLLFALEPVFALGFAVTVGGERYPSRWWWGAAIILAAVTWVEWHAARSRESSRSASG